MLLDFVDLAPGDWVVQNGANSAVRTFYTFPIFIFHGDEKAVIIFPSTATKVVLL